MLFVSTNCLADTFLRPEGVLANDEEDEPEGDARLRHMTAVSAFMYGLVTADDDGDSVRRDEPNDFDSAADGPARTREARTVSSNFIYNPSFPFCIITQCVYACPCVCALQTVTLL
jgi:hypothetical protein